MKAGLIITGVWSAILLFLSLAITGLLGRLYSGSFYWFTLPFIIAAAILVVMSIVGLVTSRLRSALFWAVTPVHGLLFVPFYFAISRWPGGDDGPGLAWLFVIGGGSFIAAALGLIFAVVGLVITVRKKVRVEHAAAGQAAQAP